MKILFKNATIITPDGSYISGSVATDERFISKIGKIDDMGYDRVIDCKNKLLTPAHFNIHAHAAMTLFRGIGEDLPLNRWLEEKIYPAEDRLTPEAVKVGSELAIAEMIKNGIVSFSDMYFFCDKTAEAVLESGIKANISRCLVSFNDNATVKNDSRFDEAVSLIKNYHKTANGRILIDMAVHAEYTNKERYLREVAEFTHENDLSMQVHVSETKKEHEECMARHNGKTPTEFLVDCGILTPSKTATATAAHCVWVTDSDIELLAENKVNVAHNPVSNLKLASGIAPLNKMLEAGVNCGFGTDGAASNNKLSVLRELQTAALIHKGVNLSADIIPTDKICSMAWENGAIAQGRMNTGKIEVGYLADIVLIDLDSLNNIPMYNPYSTIAFSASCNDVYLTMCDGKILYENGEYKTLDVEKLRFNAKHTIAHYFD